MSLVLLVAWAALGTRYILRPEADEPAEVDAIYALGVVSPERLEYAVGLVEAGYSDQLILTVSELARWEDYCQDDHDYTVTCVTPDLLSTRGEARQWAALAEVNDWGSVMVVTMIPHLTRTELYFRRCFDGEILTVNDERPLEGAVWARQFFYESAAFVRYAFSWGC
ncbi:MAG: hypothetical protein ACTHZ5_14060 [Micrococcaceae bacterium]